MSKVFTPGEDFMTSKVPSDELMDLREVLLTDHFHLPIPSSD